MFGHKKDKDEKSKVSNTPKSPSIVRTAKDGEKMDKWKQEQQKKTDKMAQNALEEEDASVLPLAVRQLELCPAPTRRHTQFLLSGYLAVKTSGGWTRKWQTRFCVLTPSSLYVYKRPPPTTDGTYSPGPNINEDQASSVVNGKDLEKEKNLVNDNDTITPQRLAKIMATADTTDDGSHELFGLIRDTIPIDATTIIMEVPQLPNTFCLTSPDCPRLLLRSANFEQFKLWMYTLRSTQILRSFPPHTIQAQLANQPKDVVDQHANLVPVIEELLPLFTERAAIINSVALHHTNQSIYTDAALLSPTATNIPTNTGGTAIAANAAAGTSGTTLSKSPEVSKDIVNSNQLNSQLIQHQQVNLNTTPSQGNIITNLTPWGQKINIVLNQIPPATPTPIGLTQTSSQLLEQYTKEQAVTINLGDGGFITVPLPTLYDAYQKHLERKATIITPSSPNSSLLTSQSSDDIPLPGVTLQKLTENYADALFSVSNSLYNADIHLAFKFSTLPATRKDAPVGKTVKKLSAKQQAALRQQQDQALEDIKKNNTPPINSFSGLVSLFVSAFLSYKLHLFFPQETGAEIATLWLIYLVLTVFTISMANITFKTSQRRQSLANDRDAITKMVSLSGFQQQQLHNVVNSASSSSAVPATGANQDQIPVLELIPIRIVDRHTITGAVLLGGAKFDHENFPALPARITFTPQISLLKAVQSNNSFDTVNGTALPALGNLQLGSEDLDGQNDTSDKNEQDDSDEEIFETDPVLGKVYVECWGKWCQSDYRGLHLRGLDYLTNKKKPKIPALPHRFQSCYTNIFELKESQPHAARWVNSYFRKQRQKAIELGKGHLWEKGTPVKYLCVNMLVPGSPNYNFVMYYRNPYIYPSPYPDDIASGHQQEYHPTSPDKIAVVYPNQLEGKPDPLAKLIDDFATKDDAYRKSRFKYIPSVAEGNWLVRKTVGQTPVILGNKLTQFYFLDPNGQYIEVDVDVSSSSVAGSILGVVKGYAKSLAIDLNFLLEPHAEDELPEALWGGCRIINIDLFNVEHIDVVHGPSDD